ncbi:Co2+/Mg2+ efflux protein ApaG [Prosthecomicrobium pneumaticum]|uniref:Protein ApaG n=1 Tax=Prosthecomicrobium pneumaticum TaxID=81895 RepID=A0A7W9FMG4_9HYPH|nr:Co2+/Mg2+ efflux protein ApaG [Prosthecomicrobium pneumaticum]MBB5753344.1 ApaG protein [Prosthecomicrobium pneumaticum]
MDKQAERSEASVYRAVTRSIQVTVEPSFVEDESSPGEGRYFWAYTVEIVNLGLEAVKLRSRFWRITDGRGRVEEVRGIGVVGKEPLLKPGESFEYTSGCPLSTPSGIMVGTYQMQTEKGEMFSVEIPAFSLDMPDATRVLH